MFFQAIKLKSEITIYLKREIERSELKERKYQGIVQEIYQEQYVKILLQDLNNLLDISLDGRYYLLFAIEEKTYSCQVRVVERYENEQGKIVLFFILSTILEESI